MLQPARLNKNAAQSGQEKAGSKNKALRKQVVDLQLFTPRRHPLFEVCIYK